MKKLVLRLFFTLLNKHFLTQCSLFFLIFLTLSYEQAIGNKLQNITSKTSSVCNEKLILKYASKIRALNKKYQTKQTKVELNFKNSLCQTNYIQSDKLFKYDIESAIQLRKNMYSSKLESHIIDSLIFSYNKG